MAWVLVTVHFLIEAGLYLQSSGQLPNGIRSAVSKQQASLVEARCPQNRRNASVGTARAPQSQGSL